MWVGAIWQMPKPGLLSVQLMNGYSDMQTKQGLGALYPGVKGHTKWPRQNGKPKLDGVPRPHMQEGHKGTQRVARAYLSSPLGGVSTLGPFCCLWATQER